LIRDVLGYRTKTLAAIKRANSEHAHEISQTTQYPTFTTIASEPRFQAVMQRVNLPR